MQTRLRVERYRQNKKVQPPIHIVGTLFGDLTNIQMPGIIDCFLVLCNKLFHEYPPSFWIVLCFLDDVADKSKIYEEPSDNVIQTHSDYQALGEKTRQQTVSGCSIVGKIKISVHPYVKVKHHLQMSLTLRSQVPSYFIIQAAVSSQGSCSHLSTAWCIFKCCIFL
jgi:hypothetical protein